MSECTHHDLCRHVVWETMKPRRMSLQCNDCGLWIPMVVLRADVVGEAVSGTRRIIGHAQGIETNCGETALVQAQAGAIMDYARNVVLAALLPTARADGA